MNSSVPNWFVPVPSHASSGRDGRLSRGPTPSCQWYVATKLPPGYRTTGMSSSRSAANTSFQKPWASARGLPGS